LRSMIVHVVSSFVAFGQARGDYRSSPGVFCS
jgi:hypothetical protein